MLTLIHYTQQIFLSRHISTDVVRVPKIVVYTNVFPTQGCTQIQHKNPAIRWYCLGSKIMHIFLSWCLLFKLLYNSTLSIVFFFFISFIELKKHFTIIFFLYFWCISNSIKTNFTNSFDHRLYQFDKMVHKITFDLSLSLVNSSRWIVTFYFLVKSFEQISLEEFSTLRSLLMNTVKQARPESSR